MIIRTNTFETSTDLRDAFNDIETFWEGRKLYRKEQAQLAIGVFIAYGINHKRDICGAMKRLGFRAAYAKAILNRSTGNCPGHHRWRCNSQGIYSLFRQAETANSRSVLL